MAAEDGAVWMVNYQTTNASLPTPLRRVLGDEQNIFTTEMLSSVATTLEGFDAFSSPDFVLFFEPPSLDERIVNQFALFSLDQANITERVHFPGLDGLSQWLKRYFTTRK